MSSVMPWFSFTSPISSDTFLLVVFGVALVAGVVLGFYAGRADFPRRGERQ